MFGKDPSDEPGQRIVDGRFAPAGRDFRTRLAGEILLDNLSIDPARLSRLVAVSMTTPDPNLSARIANAWADNFIQSTLERRYDATSYARNFLETRLNQLRQRLEDSERKLVSYASRERIIDLPAGTQQNGHSGERSIVAEDLVALNAELAKATADRVQAAAKYQLRSRSGETPQALDNTAINTMRARRADLAADYEKMITRFEPDYPPAVALRSRGRQISTVASIARKVGYPAQSAANIEAPWIAKRTSPRKLTSSRMTCSTCSAAVSSTTSISERSTARVFCTTGSFSGTKRSGSPAAWE